MLSRAFQGLQHNQHRKLCCGPQLRALGLCGFAGNNGNIRPTGAHWPACRCRSVWPAAKHQQLCQTRQATGQKQVFQRKRKLFIKKSADKKEKTTTTTMKKKTFRQEKFVMSSWVDYGAKFLLIYGVKRIMHRKSAPIVNER